MVTSSTSGNGTVKDRKLADQSLRFQHLAIALVDPVHLLRHLWSYPPTLRTTSTYTCTCSTARLSLTAGERKSAGGHTTKELHRIASERTRQLQVGVREKTVGVCFLMFVDVDNVDNNDELDLESIPSQCRFYACSACL